MPTKNGEPVVRGWGGMAFLGYNFLMGAHAVYTF